MSQNLVVVQAASGLLGCHVVKDLLDNGFSVRTIVSADSSDDKLSMLNSLKKQFNTLEIARLRDINDVNEFERLYKGMRLKPKI
jgi:nucleoside-diphosphate-sugar epimerase